MKIWYQSTVELGNYHSYRTLLGSQLEAAASPGTSIVLHGVPDGTWGGLANSQIMQVPHAYHSILSEVLFKQLRQAESEGCDGFVLGSFTEPWLRELRSLTAMPVISLPEAAMHVALSVAPKVGLVTMNRENEWFQTLNMGARGFSSRIAGIYVVQPEMSERELNDIFVAPEAYISRFVATARQAIAAQADAIIPSEGLVATIVAASGLREIDGAPVLDAIAISIAYAEMMVKLHRSTKLHAGRAWHHPMASPDVLDFLQGKTDRIGAGHS